MKAKTDGRFKNDDGAAAVHVELLAVVHLHVAGRTKHMSATCLNTTY